MNLSDIKLVIWDLDETFWQGTISEEEVSFIPEHIQFVNDLTDIGIVNSICSKNDFEVSEKALKDAGVRDFFVFPSINWSAKGHRIKNIIEAMSLRAVNVLFVDDNVQNLEEAKHFCPGIMTALPEEISGLIAQAREAEKKDIAHKRLDQYKLMEEKESAKGSFSSNEEFLYSCDIRVDICNECVQQLDRIHELILRSNQLNYTKLRQGKEELLKLIQAPEVKSGYVKVHDKFGDYGIVGFYAVKDNELIHFVFSCRTLGMKIEQYIYYLLGCPKLNIVGDVVSQLNEKENPQWINQENSQYVNNTEKKAATTNHKILFKGPCDMSQMYAFLNLHDNVVTEFSYTNDEGILTEGHNHTSQIVTALFADESRKQEILGDAEFFDKAMLDTALKNEKFDFVVLSILTDGNLGIYERKSTGERIALCEKYYDITDPKNAQKYISGNVFTSNIGFTEDSLNKFVSEYRFVRSEAEITVENLQRIWEFIDSETTFILLLGSEREFRKNIQESYDGRHIEHARTNEKIRQWAEGKNNVILLPFDKYIRNDSDTIDTINHFVKRVYYDLACDLAKIFSECREVKVKSKFVLFKATIRHKLRCIKAKLLKLIK